MKNPDFCIPSSNFVVNQGKFKLSSKTFYFQFYKCFKKVNLNVCKPAMTCFKYQVYLYGSEAITYLSAIL